MWYKTRSKGANFPSEQNQFEMQLKVDTTCLEFVFGEGKLPIS